MTRDEVVRLAGDLGFERLNAIVRLARSAVLLKPHKDDHAAAANSRIGGLPSLPPGTDWPSRNGKSLAFIAEISLEEMPQSIHSEGLPASGLLSFFYDADQTTWGFDPADAGSFAVLFAPDARSVRRRDEWPRDLPEHARYRACRLVAEETVTLPPWESVLVDALGLSRDQLDRYMDVLARSSSEQSWAVRTLLGGYPDQIQGDMMLECELVSAGLSCGDATAYQDPRLPIHRRNAVAWRQLLQVQSSDDAAMMWGDVGCLYYWIRESDLLAQRFDAAWMILQCG